MKYIGVDLGGTNIVVGVIDEGGNIVQTLTMPTKKERDAEAIFDDIIQMCQQLIEACALDETNLKGIGIGIPGSIEPKEGVIVYANNLKTSGFKAKAYIEERLPYKVLLGNDADCAALGEVMNGGAKGYEDAVVFTLGTGVGGGIIIGQKIFSGYYYGGAELGHQIIEKGGRSCTCGNKGCLEAYASATALIDRAKQEAATHKESLLWERVGGDLEKMNAKIAFDAANAGDDVAIDLIDEYMEYLAVGVANAINVFKPQVILIGGGISKQGDKLIHPLTEKAKEMVYGGEVLTKIKVATLGNDAGLIGAAMLHHE
jgi:glucokinase